jgi:hypothetical protein
MVFVRVFGAQTAFSEKLLKNKDASGVPTWVGLLRYARQSLEKGDGDRLGMVGWRFVCCRTRINGLARRV